MLFFRQLRALIRKNVYLIWNRRALPTTLLRAVYAPIIFSIIMAIVLKALWPSVVYGVGEPQPILSLDSAMSKVASTHPDLVLVNAIHPGGLIDDVMNSIADPLREAGKNVIIIRDEDEMLTTCRSTLRGVTSCYAAVWFHSSPTEGLNSKWNYTLRFDGSFGTKMDVMRSDNDQQVFMLPLQRAVDEAILATSNTTLPNNTLQYSFTSKTQHQYVVSVKQQLQKGISNFLGIVLYLALIGLCYHMVGTIAAEREIGMAQLMESMMPNPRRWEPQVLRLMSHYIAFCMTYGPSWIAIAIIFKVGLYNFTGFGYVFLTVILAGFSLASWSLFGAAFFRKAQLSGISVVVISLAFGILAQLVSKRMNTVTVGILAFLCPPMTFVFNLIYYSQWERNGRTTHPSEMIGNWNVPGFAFWIFMIVQIFGYPVLAYFLERGLHGSAATQKHRDVKWSEKAGSRSMEDETVQLHGFSKTYQVGFWKKKEVQAVKNLTFSALRGQILVLLGANGCGKSTTLDSIAGLNSPTHGSITVDGTGGIGICPQRNVLWNNLTVRQHAEIFTDLKSTTALTKTERNALVKSLIDGCGLRPKEKAMSNTLSGGQKRKLQLICMLTGGSQVCCVDEVSGGLDPLSRQYIWDILLAEKGKRTIILTTHFLDEAEVLADRMVVMSRGSLMANGSVSELKEKLGGGYRLTLLPGDGGNGDSDSDSIDESQTEIIQGRAVREGNKGYDRTWTADTVPEVISLVKRMEGEEGSLQISGPTIEEVFMRLADHKPTTTLPDDDDDSYQLAPSSDSISDGDDYDQEIPLQNGRFVTNWNLMIILLRKRLTVLRRNWKPYLAAFLFPVIATSIMVLLIDQFQNPGCSLAQQVSTADIVALSSSLTPLLVVGPADAVNQNSLGLARQVLPSNINSINQLVLVQDPSNFENAVKVNASIIVPGGVYASQNNPMYAWRGDIGGMSIYSPIFIQNLFDVLTSGVPITTNIMPFDIPWPSDTGKALQFVFYFGLVMSAFPAFFALYPNFERVTKVRELQYSNGVRPFPLWAAYALFDWVVVFLASSVMVIILAAAAPHAFWHIGYLAVVLFLYGLASILVAYNLSNLCKSQLSSFAFSAGVSALMLLLYLIAYLEITTQVTAGDIDSTLLIMHFTFGLISPIGQLLRALIVGLNLFSAICTDTPPNKLTYAGDIIAYGGPILYLILQSFLLFGLLVWTDSHFSMGYLSKFWPFKREETPYRQLEKAEIGHIEPEVIAEAARVDGQKTDGLRVLHVSKTFVSRKPGLWIKSLFSRNTNTIINAVDNVSFGIRQGEVFGLLGPNGAGKTTTISMLRGDIQPSSKPGTDILVCGQSIRTSLLQARTHLGVCPQFDATDQLTVDDQLAFYARVRGVPNVQSAVDSIVRGVGLTRFRSRLAGALSGGNRRKLSLGISLLGNPDVVLLDEPSSGMDPLAKRVMWRILSRMAAGRSILLTTHSMEEADALADRVGVMARRMLDIGSTSHLRRKYGHGFHAHIVTASEPHTTDVEASYIFSWFNANFPGTTLDGKHYHGQLRFHVPHAAVEAADINLDLDSPARPSPVSSSYTLYDQPSKEFRNSDGSFGGYGTPDTQTGPKKQTNGYIMAKLFCAIERNKQALGIRFYSVSPTTLDEVFLRVVKKHHVDEDSKEH